MNRIGRSLAISAGAVALAAVAVYAVAIKSDRPPEVDREAIYFDPTYSPAERAVDLISRMSISEKASQMVSSRAPAIERLGIREYSWWNEAIHGVAREGLVDNANPTVLINTTMYPVSLSLGSTWNPDLVYRVAEQISDEAREIVRDNTLDLNFYSPTVNLVRDPRWGRNDEAYSEDPYLTAMIAAQYVNGMQGQDPLGAPLASGDGYLKTATTLKHYAANNSEFDRLYGTSNMDERTLREYYTLQFRKVVRAADPASIMSSYNRVNGVPATANVHLLQTLGRQTFGFDGYYSSDCDSIFIMAEGHAWRPPGHSEPVDGVERNAFASAAGVDLNCQMGYHDGLNYANTLGKAVQSAVATETGTYTEAALDTSLVRLFAARIRLGEFDDPERVPWVTAARARIPAGTWVSSERNQAVTMTPERLALAREAATESIVLLRNAPVRGQALLPLRVPAIGAYRVAVVGPAAQPVDMFFGGYSSRHSDSGIAKQVNGFDGIRAAVQAANPNATVDYLPALPARGTLSAGELDEAALAQVGSYDVVVVYAATDQSVADEDADRADLALPGRQVELIRQVVARNPNAVVYLETIGQVDVSSFAGSVPALLWSSYNGQRKGEALADVLLGRVNPSGHLPFTWYADEAQLPAIDDYAIRPGPSSRGRTYMYFTGDVAYPFGHGLSYTTFAYSAARVDRATATPDDTVQVSVDVTNTGAVAGAHVVQLYAATPQAPAELERPARRLVGFAKVTIQPGQTVTVQLPVKLADLAFFDEQAGRFVVDSGEYRFELGASSADIRARVTVPVSGELTPIPVALTADPIAADADGRDATGGVIFKSGAVVEPRLTVAMNDDTLYRLGAAENAAAAFATPPPELTVTYESNRPEVVAVEPSGTIRAVAPGIATVTATVTYRGVSLSTEFALAVN